MIKLTKTAEPAILVTNAAVWTAELQAGDMTHARSYGHKDVKRALIAETNGKCAYCESKPLHVTYGDVEHVSPKKTDVTLTFAWDNLTLACDVCNTKKGARSDIFDPYADDPEQHFEFHGPLIFARAGAIDAARITAIALCLNRPALIERRTDRLKDLDRQRHAIAETTNVALRQLLENALYAEETDAQKEFSACARSFVKRITA